MKIKQYRRVYQFWCLIHFFSKMRPKSSHSDWPITTDINIWCWTTVFRLDFSFKVRSKIRLQHYFRIQAIYGKTTQLRIFNLTRIIFISKYYIPVSSPFLTRICIKVLFLFALFTFRPCSRRKCFHVAWTNKRPIIITKSNGV